MLPQWFMLSETNSKSLHKVGNYPVLDWQKVGEELAFERESNGLISGFIHRCFTVFLEVELIIDQNINLKESMLLTFVSKHNRVSNSSESTQKRIWNARKMNTKLSGRGYFYPALENESEVILIPNIMVFDIKSRCGSIEFSY